MEPDSEEMRRTLEPRVRRLALKRGWTMKGGEMEDVAGDFCQSRFFGITVRGMGEEEGFVREGRRTVHHNLLIPFRTRLKILRREVTRRNNLPPNQICERPKTQGRQTTMSNAVTPHSVMPPPPPSEPN
jgi:hypothetical protein